MTEAGEPLLQQASEAIRRHQAESNGSSPEEVERLQLLAESILPVVTDYQLRAQGAVLPTLH